MRKDLCTIQDSGFVIGPLNLSVVQPIKSNGKKVCARCGRPIMPDNDSGWEVFVGDGTKTQPICKKCDSILVNSLGLKCDK